MTVAPALALLAGALATTGVYLLSGAPRSTRKPGREAGPELSRLLWLSGTSATASAIAAWRWTLTLIIATGVLLLTANPICALLLASVAWTIPGSWLGSRAAARWAQADVQLHAMATVLQFSLPLSGNPYQALRRLLPDVEEPLSGWLEQALAGETAGIPVETALAELGQKLRHRELVLLADILRSDRRASPTEHLIAELMPEWSARTKAASERASLLAAGQSLTGLLTWGPLSAFLVVDGFMSAGQVFHASIAGQGIAALGTLIVVLAIHAARRNLATQRALETA